MQNQTVANDEDRTLSVGLRSRTRSQDQRGHPRAENEAQDHDAHDDSTPSNSTEACKSGTVVPAGRRFGARWVKGMGHEISIATVM
jgi:hypothetical protein